jgi:hypothetical protein
MSTDFLKEFVASFGTALEAEDKRIMEAGRSRGEIGGLMQSHLQAERFYQFIVWRAAYQRWPCRVEDRIGYGPHDIAIYEDSDYRKCICVLEMKTWLERDGLPSQKLNGMEHDLAKLKSCNSSDSAFVIFSASKVGSICDQLKYVETTVFKDAKPSPPEVYRFPTQNPYDTQAEFEFWVAVWPIKIGPLFSRAIISDVAIGADCRWP